MEDETTIAPVVETPEPVVEDYDLSKSSGWDDLRAAFADVEDAPVTETPVVEDPTAEVAPEPTPTGPELTNEEIGRVLQDPRAVAQLQQGYAQALVNARQLWEAELQQRRLQEEEILLDDEEVGKRFRAQQQMEPVIRQAQAAGYAQAQTKFITEGIASVWQTVPELSQLDETAKAALNPADPKYTSYGAYMNALVDAAAAVRAEKQAKTLAKTMADARVADEVNKLRKGLPNVQGVSGPAGAPGPIIDIDRMSGSQLLEAAFRN